MTPPCVHLFPHRCHRIPVAAHSAGLSNYQDLLEILNLTKLFCPSASALYIMEWFCSMLVLLVHIQFWIWPTFDNNTFPNNSRSIRARAEHNFNRPYWVPVVASFNDKDHHINTLHSGRQCSLHDDVISYVRFTDDVTIIAQHIGQSCLNISWDQCWWCNTNS